MAVISRKYCGSPFHNFGAAQLNDLLAKVLYLVLGCLRVIQLLADLKPCLPPL